jgi:S-adenosylmethionine synthetase
MAFAFLRGPGHPDQACDRVARALVEEYVKRDPESRLDIRVMGGHGALFISGDIRSTADFDAGSTAKAALASIDPVLSLEPFVSLERMESLPVRGAADPQAVFGYATDETPERLPIASAYARRILDEIERLRRDDPDWYWCGADYEVGVSVEKKRSLATVRLSHVPSIALDDLRMRAGSALTRLLPDLEWRINPTGSDARGGLAGRVGSSRVTPLGGGYGSTLPQNGSGAGLHASHPLNRGAELARNAASELVTSGACHAAWVELVYMPDENLPVSIRVRTEKGAAFDARFPREFFSLIIQSL